MNSSGELVVDTYGIPTGPHTGPGAENPLWTTDIFRIPPRTVRDLYDLGVGPDTPVISQLPETSVTYTIPLDHFSGTTSNITVIPDTQSVGPSSNFSLQMAHSTMVPHVTTIPTRNVVVNQAPIGTPLSSRPIPSLPPGYHSLNPSTAIPTQVPSRVSGLFVPPGYNVVVSFVPTPSQVLSRGSYPPFPGGSGPSGSNPIGSTHHPFTSGYQIPIGGKSHVGGYPPLGGQPQVGLYNPLYGHNTSGSLAQLWNLLSQRNPQSSGGKQPQVTSFVPPHSGQPYPGSLNPAWGLNVQSSVPFQGNISNQPNPMGYMPPHPCLNLSGTSTYMQTAYGPTGIPMGLPPQSHQYPQVNRQLPFLATLDLPDLSRILNDPILHSPHWPIIPAKLPFDIPKFDSKPEKTQTTML
jgi:hypothetical protein